MRIGFDSNIQPISIVQFQADPHTIVEAVRVDKLRLEDQGLLNQTKQINAKTLPGIEEGLGRFLDVQA